MSPSFNPSPLRGLALEQQTLPGLLNLGAERFGAKSLLRFDGLDRSFTEVRDEVAAAAGTLAEAGIVRGDRVAMMCENRIELLDLMLGCAWIGAAAVPPEKTVEAWRNLWFHTGDRVVREPDGWFRFVDRIKDTIRRRGENISSFEVEQALLSHSAVSAAAAFPVASEMAEDEVAAAIVLEEGASLEPEELMRHCEPRLAYFAIPRYVRMVEELPQTANGKVRKSVLREAGVLEGDWDREAVGFELRR